MKRLLLLTLPLVINTTAFAQVTIIEETKTWKSVPITVDQQAHTYTTVESPLPEGQYYYTYPGYRCVTQKIEDIGGTIVVYQGPSGSNDIYCYPEE